MTLMFCFTTQTIVHTFPNCTRHLLVAECIFHKPKYLINENLEKGVPCAKEKKNM